MSILSPFNESSPPNWASAWGQDEYGYYAEFSIDTGSRYWEFVSQRMRWIPHGTFQMGSPDDEPERDSDEVLHEVTLTQGYWLADTTCTQELWEAVMEFNPSGFPGLHRPVEKVSFNTVNEFIIRMNDLVPELYLRLPTEAEWEYACRAGSTTPFSYGYQVSSNQVHYDGKFPYLGGESRKNLQETLGCKSFSPNRWGLFQMHGNVWEWCQDWYGSYDITRRVDPQGDSNGTGKVVRGGSWVNSAQNTRSASRFWCALEDRLVSLGFRCLSSVSPAQPSQAEPPNK